MANRVSTLTLRLALAVGLAGAAREAAAAAPPPLTTAAAVRQLTAEEAAEGRPVRLHGRLLLVTGPRSALVVRDETDGIYVELPRTVGDELQPGDELEITGASGAGDFAPIVRAQQVRRIGPGGLPPPRPTTIAELEAGGFDAAWVELRGIVRACGPTPADRLPVPRPGAAAMAEPAGQPRESWLMTLAQGDNKTEVHINGPVDPAGLVDAEIRLRGVVFNVHNATRQFIRSSLQVVDGSMIEVLAPPVRDPFSLPPQKIGGILRFSPAGFSGHRVHVRGVVTGQKRGQTLWLREGERGLRVSTDQDAALAPGDEVEVVGFPDHRGYTPSLENAIFRRSGSGAKPEPRRLRTLEDVARHDADLVEIDAELRDLRPAPDGPTLVLDWMGTEVHARLLRADPELETLRPGSLLRVAGLCVAGQADYRRPTGLWIAADLRLWVRDMQDVKVLREAPWLTPERASVLGFSLALTALIGLIVVAIAARRQIEQREEARKLAEVEFSAMLAERNRLARDIHDTIAQELNAVSMQMELAKNCAQQGPAGQTLSHLGTAHQLVRNCLAAVRESIWNMRAHILEKTDLPGALGDVAGRLGAGADCRIETRARGRVRRLAPMVENNLLRIGQEAVSNALKHARPGRIDIELTFTDTAVRLVVLDDGPDFDPARFDPAAGGHFGLRGMKERVEQMHGEFRLGRGPAGGTRLEVLVNAAD